MDSLSGSVERITFYNPENGYTVLRLRPDSRLGRQFTNRSALNSEGLTTVVGNLPEVSPGEHLSLQGQWDNHPKHGPQFKAEVCEQTLPATLAGIEGYLGSGMIKGIGPRLAERIVGKFKEETFDVIEQARNACSRCQALELDRVQKNHRRLAGTKAGQGDHGVSARSRREHEPGGQDLQDIWRCGAGDRPEKSIPARTRHLRCGLQNGRPHRPSSWVCLPNIPRASKRELFSP